MVLEVHTSIAYCCCAFLSNMNSVYRCDAKPDNLDAPGAHKRSHEKTDMLFNAYSPKVLWDDWGIRTDVLVGSSHISINTFRF